MIVEMLAISGLQRVDEVARWKSEAFPPSTMIDDCKYAYAL